MLIVQFNNAVMRVQMILDFANVFKNENAYTVQRLQVSLNKNQTYESSQKETRRMTLSLV